MDMVRASWAIACTIDSARGSLQDVAHEAAVDLEQRHRHRAQVGQRRQAGAEIVQRDAAAELAQPPHQPLGLGDVRDRVALGQLEAEHRRVDAAVLEQVEHVEVIGQDGRTVLGNFDLDNGEIIQLSGGGTFYLTIYSNRGAGNWTCSW